VAVGSGDPDETAAMLATHFADMVHHPPSPMPAPAWPREPAAAVEDRDKAQTALVLTWPGPARSDVGRFDLGVLSGIASGLGGRLFEELRDRQSLCYTVHAFAGERRAAGTFSAYIATSPDKEAVAREGLLRELAKFRDEPVSPEELSRARTYAIGTHAIRQQSGAAVLADIVDAWLFGSLSELPDFERRIQAVSAASIQAVAQQFLHPDRRVEGIVRGSPKR